MKQSRLFLLKHKKIGKFLHRKYKSADQRKWAKYRKNYVSDEETLFSAESPIDAAMFPSISAIKTSFYHWAKWDEIDPPVNGHYYKKRPGTEWFDEMDIYILHPCVEGKIRLEKMEE